MILVQDAIRTSSTIYAKELALLVYLMVESDHPHRRGHLLGLLWPDVPEEAARNNLRVVLARLRRNEGVRT